MKAEVAERLRTTDTEPIIRPPAYGYFRVPYDLPDRRVLRVEQALRALAALRGLCLVSFFFEFSSGSQAAFGELVSELRRADAHYVVVPTLRHFAHNALLQNLMLGRLEYEAGAEVLTLPGNE